jgi:hypothetical protein
MTHRGFALPQDVFALPRHLALVMEWANCGDLKAYITSYTQENVRANTHVLGSQIFRAAQLIYGSSTLLGP